MRRVSKDAARARRAGPVRAIEMQGASWFETAHSRLLTMRVMTQ
jgi:hypothetical protein